MAEIEKEQNQVVKDVIDQKYEYGFTTDVHTEILSLFRVKITKGYSK